LDRLAISDKMDSIQQCSTQTHLGTSRWACRIHGKSQFAS